MASSTTQKPLRIAIMLEAVQMSDILGIDIFANLSTKYMEMALQLSPKVAPLAAHAIPIEFLYLASTLEPSDFVVPGNNFQFLPTHTYDTCPRDLDILLIGGPLLSHRPPAADRFMKEAWLKTPVVMTTCTGSLWLASTGLLEGKKCTTNREFLGAARSILPGIEWVDQAWVAEEKPLEAKGVKGELWTAGAAGYGLQMIAHYCLEKFDNEFVKFMGLEGLNLHNTTAKDQFYPAALEDAKQPDTRRAEVKDVSSSSSFVSRFLKGVFSWK
ncbi:isonitrile hydratase [Rhypophila sp. PSN 637]